MLFICRTKVHLVQDTGQRSEEAVITEGASTAAAQEKSEVPEELSLNLGKLVSRNTGWGSIFHIARNNPLVGCEINLQVQDHNKCRFMGICSHMHIHLCAPMYTRPCKWIILKTVYKVDKLLSRL